MFYSHLFPHDDTKTVQRIVCVGEKSCTSLLCLDLLFNRHSIVIIFVYVIVKSFLWTELLMWLWNRDSFILLLSCERFSVGRRDRTSRSQISNSMTFCSTSADVSRSLCRFRRRQDLLVPCRFFHCAAPASRDDTSWRLSLRTCPFLTFPFLQLV